MTEYLQRHPLRGPSKRHAWVPLVGLGLVVFLALTIQEGPALILPWLAMLAVVAHGRWWAAHLRRLQQKIQQVQELTLLRYHPQALRLAWRTMPAVTRFPELYLQLCALMSTNLGQLRSYEAALVCMDHVLANLPPEQPGAILLRTQRAVAQLAAEHLLDADQSLRSLREKVHCPGAEPAPALYRFAELYQAIRTLRDEDAVRACDRLIQDMRPLGMDAGYGYALAALGHHRLAQRRPEQADELLKQARIWWQRATILLPVSALASRLAELQQLVDDPRMQAALSSHRPPSC